ncbi:unnamed protein product [Fructobacillus evanidus]|uniref:Uncharacterized protein n=1 Tax=Fructobacillus evanidus TaxID=3064281 RepID=A0ABN9YKA2_9LACO|nr:unnamed protein product [Fructobacillus sp. LMG 32999]CAK1222743.1 unnamed protein product [Fructobacillus sp. LMG 32999]CAK1223573.1 unnamed protein product [Fructobacillus sp. LMG 32999]CAK1223619.1 unnamed protein product [Fructobacillus sp. LMG 32999]CAK1223766.1 unnamed protein product [Fructobacillus sp. LMG 32999]
MVEFKTPKINLFYQTLAFHLLLYLQMVSLQYTRH